MKNFFSAARWATLLAFAFLAAPDLAKGQTKLSIQGILKQNDGSAVDNGLYDLTFKLYAVAAGGTALWSETQTGLKVTGGIYSAQLGAVTALNIPFDQPYFLGVSLSGEEMSPRTALTAAPYALALSGSSNEFPGSGNVGIGTLNPTTGLDANSSISTATVTTSAAAYTVLAADHVVFLDLAGAQAVTLPSAATFPRREIVLINKTSTAKTVSSYVDLAGVAATAIPANGMIELRSNGTEWRLATTFAPAGATKAYVYCRGATTTVPNNSFATIAWTEITDTQNAFSSTTFTAPRTGIYRVSGVVTGNGGSSVAGVNYLFTGGTCPMGVASQYLGFGSVPITTWFPGLTFGADVQMNAGQTLNLQWGQVTGGPQTIMNSNGSGLTITEL